ncbi:MAG: IS91 family transposase, partial [Calditrichaeota bacterium]|nr:IS91 family transposase [Calditrichota bacterium]
MSANVTLNSILQDAGAAYRNQHRLPTFQIKAMRAIESCRTSALGGHVDRCDHCGYERVQYNSCRNRHCPNCQGLVRKNWVHAREKELLPIPYFHVVFTLPHELRPIALVNRREMYNLLFRAASETLLQLGRDERHLGGQVGIIAVLHTWGQTMIDHPHLHCIVTGGGISNDDSRWTQPKKMTPKRDFFIHVNVISDLFKKKFLDYFKRQYRAGAFKWVGQIRHLQDKRAFQKMLDQLYAKKWVTYCKRPFGGPEQVIRYLGHYTHRVAISNGRIKSYENGKVSFSWKDYRDGSKTKIMTLATTEFIRRFLLHILPDNFYRIRYYGLLANRDRKTKLRRCHKLLGVIAAIESYERNSKKFDVLLLELCGVDICRCPA